VEAIHIVSLIGMINYQKWIFFFKSEFGKMASLAALSAQRMTLKGELPCPESTSHQQNKPQGIHFSWSSPSDRVAI